jgi:dTDP-4-dehydrorhamnose reductase
VSTDCVFSGRKGGYRESDPSDAEDFYGKSKFLGEVAYPNTITLRTSIIGHELQSAHGLIDWFLAQQRECSGYRRAIFSGVPTVVLARIIRDVVIPLPELYGVYHVAAHPISKYELLRLVAEAYGKRIEIVPDDQVVIDRSLNAERFFAATGYAPSDWPELIRSMHDYRQARA